MKLVFNSNDGILSYKVNDENEFIASKNITRDKTLSYRLAVSLWCRYSCCELLDFEII